MSRLFLGFDIEAVWPETWPKGKIIQTTNRHFTLVFLGDQEKEKILNQMDSIPKAKFLVGKVGYFDKVLFLSHVVAWHATLLEGEAQILQFQKELQAWGNKVFLACQRDFCLHATLTRGDFVHDEWKNNFKPLPFMIKNLHLYESLGNSNYSSLWRHCFLEPFVEIAHTADIAFKIRGENLEQIRANAFTALAFKYPAFLEYFSFTQVDNLNELIIDLNEVVSKVDSEQGAPFKAISFHGELLELNNGILEWEMIVDV